MKRETNFNDKAQNPVFNAEANPSLSCTFSHHGHGGITMDTSIAPELTGTSHDIPFDTHGM